MADAPVTPDLHGAVEDFLAAYRAKYRNTGKGGMRSNAPMLAEVTALNAAFRAPPSPPVAAPAEPVVTTEMVDAYLIAQRKTVEEVDRLWGHPTGKAPAHMHPVREACRAGLIAALAAQLQPPRPGTAPLSDEQIIRAAVAAMPHTNPGVADDLLGGFTMHTEAEDIVAIWKAAAGHPTTTTPKD